MKDLPQHKTPWAQIIPMMAQVSMAVSRKLLIVIGIVVVARHGARNHPAGVLRKSEIRAETVSLTGIEAEEEID